MLILTAYRCVDFLKFEQLVLLHVEAPLHVDLDFLEELHLVEDIEAFELSSIALSQDLTQTLHFEWHAKFAAANDQKEFFD